MPSTLETLEARRGRLLRDLARTGDMRPGSISKNYRRCGKAGCWCASPGKRGHGPYFAFTRKVGGHTKTVNLRPGPLLSKIRKEVAAYRRFRQACRELIEINERICHLRAGETPDQTPTIPPVD
jgi:hypothetical protein